MSRVQSAIPPWLAVLVRIYRRLHPDQPLPAGLQRLIGNVWSRQR